MFSGQGQGQRQVGVGHGGNEEDILSVTSTNVGGKVSSVSWQPFDPHSGEDRVFVCGTWDDNNTEVGNRVMAYRKPAHDPNMCEDPLYETAIRTSCLPHIGDVTKVKFMNSQRVLSSSSVGGLGMYEYSVESGDLSPLHDWDSLHTFGKGSSGHCSCTNFDVRSDEKEAVSVGEDGAINIVNLASFKAYKFLAEADSAAINAVVYVKPQQILTASSSLKVKLWDLREKNSKPKSVLKDPGPVEIVNDIAVHPSQPFYVATVSSEGVLSTWDLRDPRFPFSQTVAHNGEIYQVRFHQDQPDYVYTCSQDRCLLRWDFNPLKASQREHYAELDSKNNAKDNIGITRLHQLSSEANCIDVVGSELICGSDNLSVTFINGCNSV